MLYDSIDLYTVMVWRFCCNSIFYHKITQEQIYLRNKKLWNDTKVNIIDYDVSFSDKNVVQFCRKFIIINSNLQSQWLVNYDFN